MYLGGHKKGKLIEYKVLFPKHAPRSIINSFLVDIIFLSIKTHNSISWHRDNY